MRVGGRTPDDARSSHPGGPHPDALWQGSIVARSVPTESRITSVTATTLGMYVDAAIFAELVALDGGHLLADSRPPRRATDDDSAICRPPSTSAMLNR
jgi:hypothetical protein